MLANMTISKKLSLFIVASLTAMALIMGSISYFSAQEVIETDVEDRLDALLQNRKKNLEDYLGSIKQDINIQTKNPLLHQALDEFRNAWEALGSGQLDHLQGHYIENNPHPLGQKDNLDFAADASEYSEVHKKFHPYIRTFLKERDYYDVFLIDTEGNIIYSVFKELDYATNLVSGKYKNSDIGKLFRKTNATNDPAAIFFSDFAPYAPSHGAPASFIAKPMIDVNGRNHGALIFQMPIARLNYAVQFNEGMGAHGEVYLVGADKLMRTDSRFSEESTILKQKVDNAAIDEALNNKTGHMVATDYHGVDSLTSYDLVEFLGTKWALIAEADTEEIFASIVDFRNQLILICLIVLSVIMCLAVLYIRRGVTNPLTQITDVMRRIAGGDKYIDVPSQNRSDEIGQVAAALEQFRQNALQIDQMNAENEALARQTQEALQSQLSALSGRLNDEVQRTTALFEDNSQTMKTVASSMFEASERLNTKSITVGDAAKVAAENTQTVAAATEELAASSNEIGNLVTHSKKATNDASAQAERSNGTVNKLVESADRIGEVVQLISSIANQTNLLALNATIEAARAGTAGQGFAVVASEVKGLANETAKATDEIAKQITDMQQATKSAVKDIEEITSAIHQIDEVSQNVATAVDQQKAATNEIAQSVQSAAKNTDDVSSNMSGVSSEATETQKVAKSVNEAAQNIMQNMNNFTAKLQEIISSAGTIEADGGTTHADEAGQGEEAA